MTTHSVDPARLRRGSWCHRAEKTLGEGDIAASYSADRIGMGQPLRKPFEWKGGLWVCTGIRGSGLTDSGLNEHEVYRLLSPQAFPGTPVTYRARVLDGHAGRADPNGFYHGMAVNHAGQPFVLCGPAARLVPGEPAQLDLFAALL